MTGGPAAIRHGALGAPTPDERCYPQRPCGECFLLIEAQWKREVDHLLTSVRRVDQKYGPYSEFDHWRGQVTYAEGRLDPSPNDSSTSGVQ